MRNILEYYYNLHIKTYKQVKNEYFFNSDNSSYLFIPTDRDINELREIYDVSNELIQNNILCHKIILNNNNSIITIFNNKNYILMKKLINSNDNISLHDVIEFSINTRKKWQFTHINRMNWQELWINKLQNLEYQISELGRTNDNLLYAFSYYEGIVENTLQLLSNIYNTNYNMFSISHKRLNYDTNYNEFYNPLNFVIDYSVRDVSEYLKSKLINNIDITYESNYCFELKNYDTYEKELLLIRLLFPSYQLDLYEQNFFISNNSFNKLESIIDNINEYEKIIKKIYVNALTYIPNFPYIDWLIY